MDKELLKEFEQYCKLNEIEDTKEFFNKCAKDGLVLDPLAGTGTTCEAALLENRNYYLIEKTKKYLSVIEDRLNKHNRHFL